MSKSQIGTLFFSFLFFLAGISYDAYMTRDTHLSIYKKQIEKHLHQQEKEIDLISSDRDFLYRITNKGMNRDLLSHRDEDLKRLQEMALENYTVYLTKGDSILFWNNNLISLPEEALNYDSGEKSYKFIHHLNGFYQLTSQTSIDDKLGHYTVHSLIPIKYTYNLTSHYINDSFLANKSIPQQVTLKDEFTNYAIYNSNGNLLFFLDAPTNLVDTDYQKTLLLLVFLGFLFLGAFIHLTTLRIIETKKPWLGAAFMVGSVFLIRLITILVGITDRFDNLPLFEKSFASIWSSSLSDMLINVTLLLWLMLFFHRSYPVIINKRLSPTVKFGITTATYLSIVLSFYSLTAIFKMIVFESSLNFDFSNVFKLAPNSLIAIIAIIILLSALFVFSHRMIMIISQLGLSLGRRIVALALANVMVLPLFLFSDFVVHWIIVLLISFILIIFFDMFVDKRYLNFQWLMALIAIMAAFPSFLLFMYNSYLDNTVRSDYAKILADIRDPYAEHEFKTLIAEIEGDKKIAEAVALPFFEKTNAEVVSNLVKEYINSNGYLFYNYSYQVNAQNSIGEETLSDAHYSLDYFNQKLEQAEKVEDMGIYYYENPEEEEWSYLLKIPVSLTDFTDEYSFLLLEFKKNRREQSKVYTELLIDQPFKRLERLSKYDYAIYKNNYQLDAKGNIYGPALTIQDLPEPGQFKELTQANRTEIIYHAEDGETVVIIGRVTSSIIKVISLFSYIFTLLICLVLIVFIINIVFKLSPSSIKIFPLKHLSFKSKIQLAVVGLTLSSFIFIGVTTAWFFKNSSEEYHEKRLERKASSVLTDSQREIERLMEDDKLEKEEIISILKPVSETHRLDINLYNLDGTLIGSSAKDLFEKGVISKQMGAVAYQSLARHGRSDFTQDGEHIGELTYKTAYVSLKGPNDKPVAYLGLPYYSKKSKMSNDVTLFMSTLINVYVFLLIAAGGIAMWSAGSITKQITTIGNVLKGTKLGTKQTQLEWESDDEIGVLVNAYNAMLIELEQSFLAKTKLEREGAWREMAKQVAHEIKNPLTPMKLSIQYLQHAFKNQPENIEPLVKRVSNTLIEQIDNLSKIASEFSNFAKMPQAENENLIINNFVASVYNLFRSQEVEISVDIPEEEYVVFADHNQLSRVFTNLVTNAIQAIPEDREAKINISLSCPDEHHVLVCVEDNGTGIPPDKKDKVFAPNFTTKSSGTGLGLAISKNIIKAFKGEIWFETQQNVGTKFFVKLPMVKVLKQEEELI